MGTTPNIFGCWQCKKGASRRKEHCRNTDAGQLSREGRNRITTTGRRRGHGRLVGGHTGRSCGYLYEYKCLVCGHTGWSRHVDVETVWNREHGKTKEKAK